MLTKRYQSHERSRREGDHLGKDSFWKTPVSFAASGPFCNKTKFLKRRKYFVLFCWLFSSSWETDNCEDMWSEHSEPV